MSTEQTWQVKSTGLNDTLELASAIGRRLKGGEVIDLISDLGGGKTTFVKGLAGGLGSNDRVHSPSFTLSNQYLAGELTLYHFDFYRLSEPGIMRTELAEVINDPQAVIAVEWSDIVGDTLPDGRLTIRIRSTGDNDREITFTYPEKLSYLLPSNT